MSAAKKKFPGIFVVIAVSFLVYLTIVTVTIVAHYQKPKKGNASQNIKISALKNLESPARFFDKVA